MGIESQEGGWLSEMSVLRKGTETRCGMYPMKRGSTVSASSGMPRESAGACPAHYQGIVTVRDGTLRIKG